MSLLKMLLWAMFSGIGAAALVLFLGGWKPDAIGVGSLIKALGMAVLIFLVGLTVWRLITGN